MFHLSADEIEAVRLSLRVAFWAMLWSVPFALAAALVLARGRFWGKSLLDGAVHLPLVMPPVVTGYLLLLLFGHNGPLGRFFAAIRDRLRLSLDRRGACGGSDGVSADGAGDAAFARSDRPPARRSGRHPWRPAHLCFLLVTLPLMMPGIVAGMVLSFARSLGEFGATITFVSNIPGETQTVPLAIYTLTQTPGGDPAALRLTVVAVTLAMLALLASEILARQIGRRLAATERSA